MPRHVSGRTSISEEVIPRSDIGKPRLGGISNPEKKRFSTTSSTTTISPTFHHQSTTTHSLINVVRDTQESNEAQNTALTRVSEVFTPLLNLQIRPFFPTILRPYDHIKVPKKAANFLRNSLPKRELKKIHKDIEVAYELCLLFLSQLSSTYFQWKSGENPDGWKRLHSKHLQSLVGIDNRTYVQIRDVLEYKFFEGPILECDYVHEKGVRCFAYRLCDSFIGKGVSNYVLHTEEAKRLARRAHQFRIKDISGNSICTNLMGFYQTLTNPSIEEIIHRSRQLVDTGYHTRKGKRLSFLNKKARMPPNETTGLSYVEDAIERFLYLTEDGFMVPRKGSAASGGRFVDSLTLMPSYIRGLMRTNGELVAQCDYSAFHPNIAMTLYGGNNKYVTHNDIAHESGLNPAIVKKEHLSFFNKHPKEMEKSPLYDYYMRNNPKMMRQMIDEKYQADRRYKMTSQRMLTKEVEIMCEVITRLASEGIRVGYVYDELICHPDHAGRVSALMDEVTLKHGVFTRSKVTYPY